MERLSYESEGRLLTNSYIEVGGDTDHFDAPEFNAPTTDTDDFWVEQ
ncbi:hypothetical protein [Prevotellamassilia timonensis]|nr:hypothetical protein [Prevotellamassilia timonensis]MCF2634850.1 hypothetical protein [Prevotellamassilia timonensis]